MTSMFGLELLNESPKGLDWTSPNLIHSELRPGEVSAVLNFVLEE